MTVSKFQYVGRYRGEILSSGLVEPPSGQSQSVGFAMNVRWDEYFYDADPSQNLAAGFAAIEEVESVVTVWIVGKTGNINEHGIKQLRAALGWDGDWATLKNTDWAGGRIQAEVKEESYEGKTTLKPSWVYHAEAAVGTSLNTIDEDRFSMLSRQFGSQTRAMCGAASPPAPAGRPAVPPAQVRAAPRPAQSRQPVPAGNGEMPPVTDNDVPW